MRPEIIYEDIAPGAKEDSTLSANRVQPFCDVFDLKQDNITVPKVATGEANFWALDGTFSLFPEMPENYHWGFWSSSLSGADGVFAAPPVLTITFGGLYKSTGISFGFYPYGGAWCNDLTISWYKDGDLLTSQNFAPDGIEYSCIKTVQLFNKVEITFRSMNLPYQYLKLREIIYGMKRSFGIDELGSLSLLTEISPISEELTIDTMGFDLRAKTDIPFLFQKKQPLKLYYGSNLLAVHYIDKNQQTGAKAYSIDTMSAIGVLDETTFCGGIYNGVTVGSIVDSILSGTGFVSEMSDTLRAVTVSGWLPIRTRREALTQVCFAIGAAVSTAGSHKIRIFKLDTQTVHEIGTDRIYENGKVESSPRVTGVELTVHSYTVSTESSEIFKGILSGAGNEIKFSEPYHSLTITGGTIIESGANYAIVTGAGAEVILTGSKYTHSTRTVAVKDPDLAAGDLENIIKVDSATLISSDTGAAVAQRVYDYYQKRDSVNTTLVLDGENAGDMVTVQTPWQGLKTGIITSLDISVGTKLVADAKIRGD